MTYKIENIYIGWNYVCASIRSQIYYLALNAFALEINIWDELNLQIQICINLHIKHIIFRIKCMGLNSYLGKIEMNFNILNDIDRLN